MGEVQKLVPREAVPAPRTIMDMVDAAVMGGAGIDVIERLVALHKDHEKTQARRAFDQAVADAKAEIPVITKGRKGHNGKYEDLGDIAEAIAPILSKNGLSYRFRTEQGDKITVTCIIAHKEGYSEETSLSSKPDTGPGRNEIQAIGSAVTYLQRYTLKAALGLAASADDDGEKADNAPEKITEAQEQELIELAEETQASKIKLCKLFNIECLADLPASKFEEAKRGLEGRRARRAANA